MKRIIQVIIQYRKDGGIKVWSDDIPGLILSGKNKTSIISNIEPAVKEILKRKKENFDNIQIDTIIQLP